jgi:hypothetical protein
VRDTLNNIPNSGQVLGDMPRQPNPKSFAFGALWSHTKHLDERNVNGLFARLVDGMSLMWRRFPPAQRGLPTRAPIITPANAIVNERVGWGPRWTHFS